MAELISALVEAILTLIEALVSVLLNAVLGAIQVIAYAISPEFRRRKRKEWLETPWKKYIDCGCGIVCIASLIALTVWMSLPAAESEITPEVQFSEPVGDEDARLVIHPPRTSGATNDEVTIAVKKDGLRKIFTTGSLAELTNAIHENVTVIPAP